MASLAASTGSTIRPSTTERAFALNNTRTNQGYVADHYLRNNIAFSNNSNTSQLGQPLVDDEFNTWNSMGTSILMTFS